MGKGAKLILGIVILAVVAGGAYALTRNNKNTNNNGTSSSSSSGYGSSSNHNSSSSNKPASTTSGAVVQTKTDATLGQYLATSDSLPLYTYKLDSNGTSNCTGSCLSNWPAYVATSTATNLPVNVSTIVRSDDHTVQYTYKGMPLYTFTGDSAGHITGNGVENFAIATP